MPKQYTWGKYEQDDPETYCLITKFRAVGERACLPFFRVVRKLRSSVLWRLGRFFPFIFTSHRLEVVFGTTGNMIERSQKDSAVGCQHSKPADPIKLAAGLADVLVNYVILF